MQDAEEMRRRTKELVMAYLAVGLDPKEVVLFKQSDVAATRARMDIRYHHDDAVLTTCARI